MASKRVLNCTLGSQHHVQQLNYIRVGNPVGEPVSSVAFVASPRLRIHKAAYSLSPPVLWNARITLTVIMKRLLEPETIQSC